MKQPSAPPQILIETRAFPVWVLIEPARDVPKQWVAHCLDVDVVSYGNTAAHALEMIAEASGMVIADDLNRGAEPTLRSAPKEDWDKLRSLLAHGRPAVPSDFNKGEALAMNIRLLLRHLAPRVTAKRLVPGKYWEPPTKIEKPIAALQAC